MQGEHLPLQDHTARYCPGSKLNENGGAAAPAHSGIHDTAADEMMIAELITEAVEETRPVQ